MDNLIKNCETNYGAIDIGSNAVRLLIKCVEEDEQGKAFFLEGTPASCPPSSGIRCVCHGQDCREKKKRTCCA